MRKKTMKTENTTWNSLKTDEMDDSVTIEDSISSFKALDWYESEEDTKKSS